MDDSANKNYSNKFNEKKETSKTQNLTGNFINYY